MFSNRQCLIYPAAIALLLAPSCAKQTEDDDGGSTGNKNTGNTSSIFDNGNGTNQVGNQNGNQNQSTDSNAVGQATPVSDSEWKQIQESACNAWAIEPESAPAKLQLIVDVSSSMNQTAPGTNRSKWEVTRDSLLEAICGVSGPGLANNTAVGLTFYPYKVNENVSRTATTMDQCIDFGGSTTMAPLQSGANSQREKLRAAFTDVVLGRGTPTADAYDYALNQIALSPEQQAYAGDTYLLLITDGRPTLYHGCYNPAGTLSDLEGDEVVAEVRAAWLEHQVKTFIIGSPGSEGGRDWLSQAAYEGQTAKTGCTPGAANGPYCHMDMTQEADFSQALRDGLSQVVAAVSGCKFSVPTQSADGKYQVDPNQISPLIAYGDGTRELIWRHNSTSQACDQGFRLLDNGTQVELCDGTCNKFLNDPKAKMQLIFGCQPVDIQTAIL